MLGGVEHGGGGVELMLRGYQEERMRSEGMFSRLRQDV